MKKDNMPKLSFSVPVDLHRRIKIFCATEGIKIQDLAFKALEKYLEEHIKLSKSKEN